MLAATTSKTQFYAANGAGRDSYIHSNNGGFCPSKEPCKIDENGKLSKRYMLEESNLL